MYDEIIHTGKNMNSLRDKVPGEFFDYLVLMDTLSDYKSPRSKVTQLLHKGEIIRIKKGLYVFGPRYRRSLVNLEPLANQIYGPSYVSLEYALAYYRLIPEFVAEVTCVTTKRHKMFETPLGRFSYFPLPLPLYSIGFTLNQVSNNVYALMATKEKAFADLLYFRKFKIKTNADLEALLFEDLRLEEEDLKKFRIGILAEILKAGGNPVLSLLINWLRQNK